MVSFANELDRFTELAKMFNWRLRYQQDMFTEWVVMQADRYWLIIDANAIAEKFTLYGLEFGHGCEYPPPDNELIAAGVGMHKLLEAFDASLAVGRTLYALEFMLHDKLMPKLKQVQTCWRDLSCATMTKYKSMSTYALLEPFAKDGMIQLDHDITIYFSRGPAYHNKISVVYNGKNHSEKIGELTYSLSHTKDSRHVRFHIIPNYTDESSYKVSTKEPFDILTDELNRLAEEAVQRFNGWLNNNIDDYRRRKIKLY